MPADPVRRSCLALALAAAAALLLGACGSGTSSSATSAPARGQTAATAGERSQSVGCAPTGAPAPRGAQRVPKPTRSLDPNRHYVVRLSTNCGTIEIQLAVRSAPRTTASFAYLVARGFYDGLTFHRVAAEFVIQGGDPNGDGTGGPGYSIVEPPPSNTQYTRGTVAMAKTSADPSGASGSQFFIVTATRAPLPPQYALVGNVVGGMTAVEAIDKLPTDPPQDGAPIKPVVIAKANLSSS